MIHVVASISNFQLNALKITKTAVGCETPNVSNFVWYN
jgi:hypothetical protein